MNHNICSKCNTVYDPKLDQCPECFQPPDLGVTVYERTKISDHVGG